MRSQELLQQQIQSHIENRSLFSDEQFNAIIKEGSFLVRACPGSGKTTTVSARVAHRIVNNKIQKGGIAAISFTNVAVKEITEAIQKLGVNLASRHFVGTLNSFINRHIFLPYGHLVMGIPRGRRPSLVLEHDLYWAGSKFKLDGQLKQYNVTDFHFTSKGQLHWKPRSYTSLSEPANFQADVLKVKLRMAAFGYATHSDSMFWSLKALAQYPTIAQALARRYPEIIVDEFQDTSGVQLALLFLLHATDQTDFVFVGDPNQSIYEFHKAEPRIFTILESRGWEVLPLTQNFRSSAAICRVSSHFAPSGTSIIARPSTDVIHPVEILLYDDQAQLATTFSDRLSQKNIAPNRSAILASTNKAVESICGERRGKVFPDGLRKTTIAVLRAVNERDNGRFGPALQLLMRTMTRMCFDEAFEGNRSDVLHCSYREWKLGCSELLMKLPALNVSLADWITSAKSVLDAFMSEKAWSFHENKKSGTFIARVTDPAMARNADQFFNSVGNDLAFEVKTIHAAKGESHDATMIVFSTSTTRDDFNESNDSTLQHGMRTEPVRKAFVGVSRPRELLMIALPKLVDQAQLQSLIDACSGDVLVSHL